MKFPLKANKDSSQIPGKALCLSCEKKAGEIEGFIQLTTGSYFYTDKKREYGGPHFQMDAIFSIWYHGPHKVMGKDEDGTKIIDLDNKELTLEVIEPVVGGQVDFHFCSIKCLEDFFLKIVSELKNEMSTIES